MTDVAVQTICSYLDEESSPKVKLKEEQEERGTDRLQQLLNASVKVGLWSDVAVTNVRDPDTLDWIWIRNLTAMPDPNTT